MPGGDAAVLLALDEQRVEHGAAVVDGDVAQQRDLAGVAGRPRRRRCARRTGTSRRPGRSRAGRRGRACRRRGRSRRRRVGRRGGQRTPSRAPAAGTPATPTVPASVSTTMSPTSASSRWAARCLALSTSASVASQHRRAAELQRPRSAGAAAGADQIGVDRRRAGCARPGCRSARLTIIANAVWWPCPWADVPAMHGGRAVVVDLDRAVLAGAAAGGDLDVGRHADAEQRAVATSRRRAACSARSSS